MTPTGIRLKTVTSHDFSSLGLLVCWFSLTPRAAALWVQKVRGSELGVIFCDAQLLIFDRGDLDAKNSDFRLTQVPRDGTFSAQG